MKVNAIIAEYNPLHIGHEYLIQRAKELTGADYTVVVMSGNYVQRGEPAVMDKTLRTKAALMSGADLVIELPLYYSLASAEYFAKGAVALINSLGICDYLVFGCEYDNIDLHTDIAMLSIDHEKEYYELIVKYMSDGNSYPKSESLAISDIVAKVRQEELCNKIISATAEGNIDSDDKFSDSNDQYSYDVLSDYSVSEIAEILAAPNSTLAICYLKSLISLNAKFEPVAVKRIVSGYNDLSLGALSSSAIRKELLEANYSPLKDQFTDYIYDLMAENINVNYPVGVDEFSDILIYKLRSLIYSNGARLKSAGILALTDYLDVSEALAGRIINNINEYKNFSQFVALLKTKSVTYSHISRALMHIVLDIKKSNATKYINNNFSLYARILGFKKESTELLSEMKYNATVPVISKLADAEDIITDQLTLKHLNESVYASEMYSSLVSAKFNYAFTPEHSQQIVIL